MKFGLFNLMTQLDSSVSPREIIRDTVSMVQLADEVGFDIAWFAEHHFSNYSICPSPLVMAAHCAGLTKRIRLGAAVLVLPLYNPMRMVQEIGLLDVASDGRAVIGIGSGYQRYEFERFGLELDEKGTMFHEMWDILEMALTGGEVEYHGRHYDLPPSPVAMRPLQQPMPELFVTGMALEVLQRTARGGHTPFITGGWRGLGLLRELRKVIETAYREAGFSTEPLPLAVQQYVHVTDSKEEARDLAERVRYTGRVVTAMRMGVPGLDGPFIEAGPIPEEPPLETFQANAVIGSPEHCAECIAEEIRLLKPRHYSCFMQIASLDGRRARRSLERFAGEVIPLLERELGPLAGLNEAPLGLAGE
jgi:alkanesulfonate monooxygenase SsuD/methylene tetrahydromethanopterin reductase-like flavin-dependent oxidoreductase (luciferase family)